MSGSTPDAVSAPASRVAAAQAGATRHVRRVRSAAPQAARSGIKTVKGTSTFGDVQKFILGLTGAALLMLVIAKPAAFSGALQSLVKIVTDVVSLGDISHA